MSSGSGSRVVASIRGGGVPGSRGGVPGRGAAPTIGSSLYVTCASGSERALHKELARLGYKDVRSGSRGVYITKLEGNNALMKAIYEVNYRSRVATRVLLPLLRFPCTSKEELYDAVHNQIEWNRYIPHVGLTFAIDSNVHPNHPTIRHSLYATQVTKDAIVDHFAYLFKRWKEANKRQQKGSIKDYENQNWRPNIDVKNPDIQLNLRVTDKEAVLSVDTSGTTLNQRGYRVNDGIGAPLRENLAATILYRSGYQEISNNKHIVLCDPCCEAAMMATNTPPGFLRDKWGFTHLPGYSEQEWLQYKELYDKERRPLKANTIIGIDISVKAVRACEENFRKLGISVVNDFSGAPNTVVVLNSPFQQAHLDILPNYVITNPPYGERVGKNEDLNSLYRDIGSFLQGKTQKPAKGYVYTSSPSLINKLHFPAASEIVLYNGGIESKLYEFDLRST